RRAQVPDGEVRIEAVSPPEMASRLAGAGAGVSFIQPCVSNRASPPATVDAGDMSDSALEEAAARLVELPPVRAQARELARREFSSEDVGVARYRELYERLAG